MTRAHLHRALALGLACAALACSDPVAVIPGEVYRAPQPTPIELDRWITRLGLHSVANLRESGADRPAYFSDLSVTEARQVALFGMNLSARHLPSRTELVRLIEILDGAPRPLLVHCKEGVDRSGLAAALALLLEGEGIDAARDQFALRYGYPGRRLGSPLPEVLDAYAAWLHERALETTPGRVREWAREHYVPRYFAAQWELLELQRRAPAGQQIALRARVTNRSERPIPLRRGAREGVRVDLRVRTHSRAKPGSAQREAEHDVATLFAHRARWLDEDRDLAPGEALEVALQIPPPPRPGHYLVALGLYDEAAGRSFARMGSAPLETRLLVVDGDTEHLRTGAAAIAAGAAAAASDDVVTLAHGFDAPRPPRAALACPDGTRLVHGDGWYGRGRWCVDADGRRQGPARFEWSPGHLRFEAHFRDDVEDGVWQVFGRSDAHGARVPFVAGRVDGEVLRWDRDGRLLESTHWRAGRLDGLHVRYWPDGSLRERAHFDAGEPSGEVVRRRIDGSAERPQHAAELVRP